MFDECVLIDDKSTHQNIMLLWKKQRMLLHFQRMHSTAVQSQNAVDP